MESHVNLGLDLAGIHLVLGVDLDKAIENKTNRLTQRIADRFTRDEIDVERVEQLGGDKVDHIEVVTKQPEDLEKYIKDMSKNRVRDCGKGTHSTGPQISRRIHYPFEDRCGGTGDALHSKSSG